MSLLSLGVKKTEGSLPSKREQGTALEHTLLALLTAGRLEMPPKYPLPVWPVSELDHAAGFLLASTRYLDRHDQKSQRLG